MTAITFPTFLNPLAFSFPFQGSHIGESQYDEIKYKDRESTYKGILDTSTLDETGNGEVWVYQKKELTEHYFIALFVTLAMPFYTLGTMAYNALRILPIALYLIAKIPFDFRNQQYFQNKKSLFQITAYHLKAILYQTWLSIANIVRTPIYALGMQLGLLYGIFVDPLNGRKIVAAFERGWNHNLTRNQSFWMTLNPNCITLGSQENFKFEGDGHPDELGKHAFYIPGCYQPFAKATFENGSLKSVTNLKGTKEYETPTVLEKPTTTTCNRIILITTLAVSVLATGTCAFIAYCMFHGIPAHFSFIHPAVNFFTARQVIFFSAVSGLMTLRLASVAKTHLQRKLKKEMIP
jgi:hypothetical protein